MPCIIGYRADEDGVTPEFHSHHASQCDQKLIPERPELGVRRVVRYQACQISTPEARNLRREYFVPKREIPTRLSCCNHLALCRELPVIDCEANGGPSPGGDGHGVYSAGEKQKLRHHPSVANRPHKPPW